MAIRQYIGARYMPKFMGTYDATQAYEALSVVDNGMGTSYVSNKPVPAGTPLTDTTYWALYGTTSGAITNLQNQIDTINNVTIPAINEKIEKNIVVIGNSFVTLGCADALIADFDHSYKYTNGGIGFVAYTGHNTTFESRLDDAIIDNNLDNDSVTDILFVSAMGDTRAFNEDSNNYETALINTFNSIATKVANNFTNCKRIAVTLAESREKPYFADNKLTSLFGVHRLFKINAPFYNIDYIGWSGFNNLYKSGLFEADQYHPSTTGVKSIAGFIKASYYGHIEYITHSFNQNVDCNFASGAKFRILSQLTPEMVTLQTRAVSSISGKAVTAAQHIQLFSMEGTRNGIPAPSINTECWSQLIRNDTGQEIEFWRLSFKNDTNGIMECILLSTPSTSTWGSYDGNLTSLNNYSYPIVITPGV